MAMTTRWMGPGFDLVSGAHPMDRVFEQFFGYGPRTEEGGTPTQALPIDIVETDDAYELYATVAGVPEDGVEVTFDDGMLNLAVKAVPFQTQGKLIRQERPWGNWSRKLQLPKGVDSAGITAEFNNGVLAVTMPKAVKAQPLQIAIGVTDKAVKS
jgi:HSP20 family protein